MTTSFFEASLIEVEVWRTSSTANLKYWHRLESKWGVFNRFFYIFWEQELQFGRFAGRGKAFFVLGLNFCGTYSLMSVFHLNFCFTKYLWCFSNDVSDCFLYNLKKLSGLFQPKTFYSKTVAWEYQKAHEDNQSSADSENSERKTFFHIAQSIELDFFAHFEIFSLFPTTMSKLRGNIGRP